MEEQQLELTKDSLKITSSILRNLKTASKWAKIIAIANFVMLGLLLVLAIFLIVGGAGLALSMNMPAFPITIVGFFYLIIIAVVFFPVLYLYRFACRMNKAIAENRQNDLEVAIKNLKAMFRYNGILTLISVIILVLVLLLNVIIGMSAAFMS